VNENAVVSGIQEMAKLNYGGFFIEASGGPTTGLSEAYMRLSNRPPSSQGVVFLSDDYFRFYKLALEEAKQQGLEVMLYDDYAYPTGTVAGQLYSTYPQYMAKNLHMAEQDVTGPQTADLAIPEGIYIGAVLMNRDSHELVDVSGRRSGSRLICRNLESNLAAPRANNGND